MMAFPIVVGCLGGAVFLALFFKLVQRNRALYGESRTDRQDGWSEEWFEEFSAFRYLPMRRLLSEEEEEYWMESTGSGQAGRSAFRADRRRLFREYLQLIASDFARLSEGVKLSIIHAKEDRTADIDRLIALEWNFRKLLFQARLRLAFHWLGVKPVDVTLLINALQGFEFSLREVRLGASAA